MDGQPLKNEAINTAQLFESWAVSFCLVQRFNVFNTFYRRYSCHKCYRWHTRHNRHRCYRRYTLATDSNAVSKKLAFIAFYSVRQSPTAPHSAIQRHTAPYNAQKKLNRPTKQRSIQLKNKFFKDLEVVQSVVEGDVLSHLTHHLIVTGSLSVPHPGTKDVAHDSAEVLVPWI